MVKSIEYELENVVELALPGKNFTPISNEESKRYFNEDSPMVMVYKCREESELTFAIMNHFELLQTTRSLSNICGNLWKRSLENRRAERNEFFIMHECKKRQLIIPDKFRREKDEEEENEPRRKYQGGMVLEPQKGFYSDYILLLDFNSLYPSIIREYNICFSKIERPKLPLDFYYKSKARKKERRERGEAREGQPDNPENDQLEVMFSNVKSCKKREDWGFLPELIHFVVEQRKNCKKKIKKTNKPEEIMILDLQQKCYKVVANSIYGCLGLSVSRFYSMPLAALITKKGRESLLSAKDIVTKKGGMNVIYGDTDSLMIQPLTFSSDENLKEIDKIMLVKKAADEHKADINKLYTVLEIDIDGVFKPLILLMKKKYVANKLMNFDEILTRLSHEPKFHLECKGIETVRRDGCKLARDTLEKVINILV
jgi:DNA polymerase alpha subunit A